MKKRYYPPTVKAFAMICGSRLLQRHSVRAFKREVTSYIGDFEEDDEKEEASSGSRYIGDVDEE
jgi:hypothetical protein